MKQIDEITREIKKAFSGSYNNFYQSVTIYLNTERNTLYAHFFAQGNGWLVSPMHLIPLATYHAMYGNWADEYGSSKNWKLTKKRIATDIKAGIKEYDNEHTYYGKVVIPSWLNEEIDHYSGKSA